MSDRTDWTVRDMDRVVRKNEELREEITALREQLHFTVAEVERLRARLRYAEERHAENLRRPECRPPIPAEVVELVERCIGCGHDNISEMARRAAAAIAKLEGERDD